MHYYKSEEASRDLKSSYEQFASENKGIFRIGSCNCEDNADICKKEGVTSFPTVRVYPTFPIPTQDLDLSKGLEIKALKKAAGRFISDRSIEITGKNHQTFITEDIGTPKVLLFTNAKKGTPFVYKALSQAFEKTLQLGIVRESEDALVKKYKVKSFPHLVVIKSEGKPLAYDGKEFKYQEIFEFLNIHSQIFVDPNAKDNAPKQSSASKPWLVVPVPEMTKDSANDICLKKGGSLCVVLLVKDKASLDESLLEKLDAVSQSFTSKISRGITFIFSWLNASTESEFASVFGVEQGDMPKLVILNPGKRKRFLIHDGEINEAGIENTFNKILGGDARFKNIKGNKLPELVSMYD